MLTEAALKHGLALLAGVGVRPDILVAKAVLLLLTLILTLVLTLILTLVLTLVLTMACFKLQ